MVHAGSWEIRRSVCKRSLNRTISLWTESHQLWEGHLLQIQEEVTLQDGGS